MKLLKQLKTSAPEWLADNMLFANIHGSEMYGCSTDTSDKDIYGICLPPKHYLFPHLDGWINGFSPPATFEQWQQHHITDNSTTYDISVHSITHFLRLALGGNPGLTECLFAPQDCILHKTTSFDLILDIKQEFLTKKSVPRFRGYMVSQFHKVKSKKAEGKRVALVEKFGYDVKFASHCVRLGLFCEQILNDRWLDIRRDREILKSIRRGDFTLVQLEEMVQQIINRLDKALLNTSLPDKPNVAKVYETLVNVIEHHYGSIAQLVYIKSQADLKLEEIRKIVSGQF